jgi:hypothetical protein
MSSGSSEAIDLLLERPQTIPEHDVLVKERLEWASSFPAALGSRAEAPAFRRATFQLGSPA